MSELQRDMLGKMWFIKAETALDDARLLSKKGSLAACVNRLYYAAFYAVSAVLALQGKSYGKHSAVRSSLHRDFINTGLLDKKCGQIYDILLSRREQADYQPALSFEIDEIREYLISTEVMLQELRKL